MKTGSVRTSTAASREAALQNNSSAGRVAGAVVLLIAILLAGDMSIRGLRQGLKLASPDSTRSASDTFNQFACVERSIHAAVPDDGKIWVNEEDPLWVQRLHELSTPRLDVVQGRERATHELSVENVSPDQGCQGVLLNVTPR